MEIPTRIEVGALMVCAVMASGGAGFADSPSGCTFQIAPRTPSPEILAAPFMKERAMVMAQPDSPLAILSVDLTGLTLNVSGGSFDRSGQHAMDVKNVSDQVLTDAEVRVHVGSGPASGVGSGFKVGRPLHPGEQTRIEWKSGDGRGYSGTDDAVSVVAMVDLVKSAGCTYKPSQAWPTRPGTLSPLHQIASDRR